MREPINMITKAKNRCKKIAIIICFVLVFENIPLTAYGQEESLENSEITTVENIESGTIESETIEVETTESGNAESENTEPESTESESTLEENADTESTDTKTGETESLESESSETENSEADTIEKIITTEYVQGLIDTLPNIEDITADNIEEVSSLVEEIYDAIDMLPYSELDLIDTTVLEAVAIMLQNSEMGGQNDIELYAEVVYTDDASGLKFTINSDSTTATISGIGTCTDTDLIIPTQVTAGGTSYTVTAIGSMAFWGCTNLLSVTIPNSVTSIGELAFCGCWNLQSINIPSGITSIEKSTFSSCESLKSVTIPSTVTSIGSTAFDGCKSLKEIELPYGITQISSHAFQNCSAVISVTIPANVGNLAGNAFASVAPSNLIILGSSGTTNTDITTNFVGHLNRVTSLTIAGNIKNLVPTSNTGTTLKGFNELQNIYITGNIESPINTAFNQSKATLENLSITGTASIGADAFKDFTTLKNVDLSGTVNTIGANAFSGCTGLESIIFGDVNEIGESALAGCTSLTSVVFPKGITSISANVLNGCTSLTTIKVPNTVEDIGDGAFADCENITSIQLPYAHINSLALSKCSSLQKIGVPCTSPIFDDNNSISTDTYTSVNEKSIVDPDNKYRFKITYTDGTETKIISGDIYMTQSWGWKASDSNEGNVITAYCVEGCTIPEWKLTAYPPKEAGAKVEYDLVPIKSYSSTTELTDKSDLIDEITIAYEDSNGNISTESPTQPGQYTAIITGKGYAPSTTRSNSTEAKAIVTYTINSDGSVASDYPFKQVGSAPLMGTLSGSAGDDEDETNGDTSITLPVQDTQVYENANDTVTSISSNSDIHRKDNEPKTGDSTTLPLATLAMIAGMAYLLELYAEKNGIAIGLKPSRKKQIVDTLIARAKGRSKAIKYFYLALIFIILLFFHSVGKIEEFENT